MREVQSVGVGVTKELLRLAGSAESYIFDEWALKGCRDSPEYCHIHNSVLFEQGAVEFAAMAKKSGGIVVTWFCSFVTVVCR